MTDDKKATVAQESDNAKAADTADNKDAKELSADELKAVAGGKVDCGKGMYCGKIIWMAG